MRKQIITMQHKQYTSTENIKIQSQLFINKERSSQKSSAYTEPLFNQTTSQGSQASTMMQRQNGKMQHHNTNRISIQGNTSATTTSASPQQGRNLVERSNEVHEVLSHVPHWIVRWGITVMALIIVGLLMMSYLLKYPDVVKGMVTLRAEQPPITLLAKTTGSISILKSQNEVAVPNDIIAVIKNEADIEDVTRLKQELDLFVNRLEQGWSFEYYELPANLKLGMIQTAYSAFYLKFKEKKSNKLARKDDQFRKQNMNKQLGELEIIKNAKKQSVAIKKEVYENAKKLLETRYKKLLEKGMISVENYNQKETEAKNLLDAYYNDRMVLNEIEQRILTLSGSKVELDLEKNTQEFLNDAQLLAALEDLKNVIANWEDIYLIKAPITGTIEFPNHITNNRFIHQEQNIVSIVPSIDRKNNQQSINAVMDIESHGAGKVALGQMVKIELDDYPKKEYGVLEGEVTYISNMNKENEEGSMYQVSLSLPKGFITTAKKDIYFKHNMKGKGEIITKDIRLIQRFFNEFRNILE